LSHTKIAPKILEVMRQIPSVNDLGKLSEVLIEQKLITKVSYEIIDSKERVTARGVTWQLVMVSCKLTIIDFESDEEITYIALGSGMDCGDKAVMKAQRGALWYAWIAALSIEITESASDTEPSGDPDHISNPEPEIIVETPESKLIATIGALWKWDQALFPDYVLQRFKRPIDQLNISELSVLKSELENYGR